MREAIRRRRVVEASAQPARNGINRQPNHHKPMAPSAPSLSAGQWQRLGRQTDSLHLFKCSALACQCCSAIKRRDERAVALRRGHVTMAVGSPRKPWGIRWPSTPGANQPPPANPRSPLDAGHGPMSSIRACTCPNLSTKRCERPPSKSAAKSMISSCKGSILRSGSAVIHRLTISGWGERDEDTSRNSS